MKPVLLRDSDFRNSYSFELWDSVFGSIQFSEFRSFRRLQRTHPKSSRTFQFAKSEEFSNVWALQILERKVLLSVLNSRKIFKRDILLSNSVEKSATQKSSVFCD